MYFVLSGAFLLVLGLLAAVNSLSIVRRAVRVWPRPLDRRDAEAIATYEFFVRLLGLLIALAGLALILTSVST